MDNAAANDQRLIERHTCVVTAAPQEGLEIAVVVLGVCEGSVGCLEDIVAVDLILSPHLVERNLCVLGKPKERSPVGRLEHQSVCTLIEHDVDALPLEVVISADADDARLAVERNVVLLDIGEVVARRDFDGEVLAQRACVVLHEAHVVADTIFGRCSGSGGSACIRFGERCDDSAVVVQEVLRERTARAVCRFVCATSIVIGVVED